MRRQCNRLRLQKSARQFFIEVQMLSGRRRAKAVQDVASTTYPPSGKYSVFRPAAAERRVIEPVSVYA
jgi:hypothetical protein